MEAESGGAARSGSGKRRRARRAGPVAGGRAGRSGGGERRRTERKRSGGGCSGSARASGSSRQEGRRGQGWAGAGRRHVAGRQSVGRMQRGRLCCMTGIEWQGLGWGGASPARGGAPTSVVACTGGWGLHYECWLSCSSSCSHAMPRMRRAPMVFVCHAFAPRQTLPAASPTRCCFALRPSSDERTD